MSSRVVTEYLVIGGGIATAKLLSGLAQHGFSRRVTVVCDEPEIGYNRVMLPVYLSGSIDLSDFKMDDAIFAYPYFSFHPNVRIIDLDLDQHVARSACGRRYHFNKLILATGSNVPRLNVSGENLAGVVSLRNLEDASFQLNSLGPVLVVGGGLLGIEVADGLRQQGRQVILAHRGSHLMNRHLDPETASRLSAHLNASGIEVLLNAEVSTITGEERVREVEFADGTRKRVDSIVKAIGTQPNTTIAQFSGLKCGWGIEVDDCLRASVPNVFAIGECANTPGGVASLVETVGEQAKALAQTIALPTPKACGSTIHGTYLKVVGLNLFAIGRIQPSDQDACIDDLRGGVYRRLFLNGSRLMGAVLFGDISGARKISSSIGTSLNSTSCNSLAFGS